MFSVYQSNRLEVLAAQLAAVIAEPCDSPLQAETIVVPQTGMGRWLTLQLATAQGISANHSFPLPAAFVWQCFSRLLPDLPPTRGFSRDVLFWRLFGLCESLDGPLRASPLQHYLQGADALQRAELAERLAQVFDQYLVYRPDWIRQWQNGSDKDGQDGGQNDWQAHLWRLLVATSTDAHWVQARDLAVEQLRRGKNCEQLPQRVCLFAIPAMSPGFLQVLFELGRRIDVHLFQLNPCQEYWGDVVSDREKVRRGDEPISQYLDVGNELLASMGRQGRDFIDMVIEPCDDPVMTMIDPGADCLLHRIQQDILLLRQPGSLKDDSEERFPAGRYDSDDNSIQLHACHAPLREVEVLYDQLLAMFEDNPALLPNDIVVLMPDIDTYAPYIDAVFASTQNAARLPFTIADRRLFDSNRLAAALFDLLQLASSRFAVDDVLALLEVAAVRQRFALHDDDLEMLQQWVREAGIRWGIDAGARAAQGQPAERQNTWRAGLDRMLLAYAMPMPDATDGGDELFHRQLPIGDIEGQQARCLGSFLNYTDALFELGKALEQPRTVPDWCRFLATLLGRFFSVDEEQEPDLQCIREALTALHDSSTDAGFEGTVPLAVLRSRLQQELERGHAGGGFPGSGITFAAMLPMRSVPFDVICLLGMNDGSFPRLQIPPGFDRMARDVRRGDNSRRADDRYLFLEILLSARSHLYISYTGASIQDNTELPPSVLVSELLDYIAQCYERPLQEIRHPLQGFSRHYFSPGSALFSYSERHCQAARAATRQEREQAAFFAPADDGADRPSVDDGGQKPVIELDDLLRFFAHPVRWFLQRRSGIYLDRDEEPLSSRDPFEPDRLETYRLDNALLTRCLPDARNDSQTDPRTEPEALRDYLRATMQLPAGIAGQVWLDREVDKVGRLIDYLKPRLPDHFRDPLQLDLDAGIYRLRGRLDAVDTNGLFRYGLQKQELHRILPVWIQHLALNCLADGDDELAAMTRQSRCITTNQVVLLEPVPQAAEILRDLLALYDEGQHRPLHFFPRTAAAFAEGGDRGSARAESAWHGNENSDWSESQDAYNQLAMRGTEPLDAGFEALAQRVYGPLIEHCVEGDA